MRFPLNTELDLSSLGIINDKYIISKDHRERKPNKSFWIIKEPEEVECFITSLNNGWKLDNLAWGFIRDGNNFKVIGQDCKKTPLKIAKFIDSTNSKIWHGYPINTSGNPNDVPHQNILKLWKNSNIINKSEFNKLKQGKRCDL